MQRPKRVRLGRGWGPGRARGEDLLGRPVAAVVRQDVPKLSQDCAVEEALAWIRAQAWDERPFYFYVVDEEDRLVGVIPTRRLLTAPREQRLGELMVRPVKTVPKDATLLEAYQALVDHRFLALPVVDEAGRMLGVVDVGAFLGEPVSLQDIDTVFETVGLHLIQAQKASPWQALRLRSPWLLATLLSGLICALLTTVFQVALERSLVLAFFLTLALGLGESVAMQAATLTILALRARRPSWPWYGVMARREAATAFLLGGLCGGGVGLLVWLWFGEGLTAVSVGVSLVFSMFIASTVGVLVPTLLHLWKLDPKVAAGPIVLALSDVCTILLYFGLAVLLL